MLRRKQKFDAKLRAWVVNIYKLDAWYLRKQQFVEAIFKWESSRTYPNVKINSQLRLIKIGFDLKCKIGSVGFNYRSKSRFFEFWWCEPWQKEKLTINWYQQLNLSKLWPINQISLDFWWYIENQRCICFSAQWNFGFC